ncbi:MAG: glutamate--tRNA ligase [Euryarchaeota archaeon]|jgi:glutamyl-tRNA synthetase|nr:glutamate--tRNA ligase [Euryarchaeota archaeon]|tara:strand:- start:3513 stop:5243 length:1731 start_codon:yes stop_codon:yes gene_type:complete
MVDSDNWDSEIIATVRKYALQNAVEYDGAGQAGSVLGRLLGERADLRKMAQELKTLVEEEVASANKLASSQGIQVARDALAATNPEALHREKQKKRVGLKELPNAEQGKVVLRFAPNPNGPLTLGHARGVSINSEYAKMYHGKVVLRFDDTDSKVKPPMPAAYDWIKSDYEWLTGTKADIIIRASERMPVYLDHAEQMLAGGFGYVCRCSAADFKKLRDGKDACPCRPRSIEDNLIDWKLMIEGNIAEGEAVVRVKTDMDLPNPALRDWPALRIQHSTHPMVGERYKVWPLLDFQSAIEDHQQGVTHIIRGKDLMDSTRKQTILYSHFGWTYPETLYWGRVKVHDFGGFSTSGMRTDIENGVYSGWDDARLPTLRALRRRGFNATALRAFWIDLGLTQKDISVSLQTIEAFNAKEIDANCERRAFVRNAVCLDLITEIDESNPGDIISISKHPDGAIEGSRIWNLGSRKILVEKQDAEIETIRLKDYADISNINGKAIVQSWDRSDKRPIVHWIPENMAREAELSIPHGMELRSVNGMIEDYELKIGQIIQLERVGFAKIESLTDDLPVKLIWLHS